MNTVKDLKEKLEYFDENAEVCLEIDNMVSELFSVRQVSYFDKETDSLVTEVMLKD